MLNVQISQAYDVIIDPISENDELLGNHENAWITAVKLF